MESLEIAVIDYSCLFAFAVDVVVLVYGSVEDIVVESVEKAVFVVEYHEVIESFAVD
jgi:hypothetical protein